MGSENEGIIRGVYIFYGIGLFAGLLRIAIRTYVMKRPGLEEFVMAASMLFWTGDVLLSIVLLRNGTNQMSPELRATITQEELKNRTLGAKALITAWFCYITFIWGAKTCLLMFYNKLMQRIQQIRVVKLAAVMLAVTYIAVILSMFLVCRPFHKNWQVVPDPGPKCTDGYEYVWIIGIMNVFTDGVLIAIPLPVVLKLQVSATQKALLVMLFGSGIFVMVATMLRIHFTIGGDVANLTFWCMIETTSAMLVVNAPGIVSIYGHFTSRNSSSGGGGNDYQLRNSGGSRSHGRAETKPRSGLSMGGKYEGQNTTTCSRVRDDEQDYHSLAGHAKSLPTPKKTANGGEYTSGGDSRERIIIDAGAPDGYGLYDEQDHLNLGELVAGKENGGMAMVIHRNVTYAVTTEYTNPLVVQDPERGLGMGTPAFGLDIPRVGSGGVGAVKSTPITTSSTMPHASITTNITSPTITSTRRNQSTSRAPGRSTSRSSNKRSRASSLSSL